MDGDREFKFSREDFDFLRKLVTETTGIVAGEDKYTMYYSRLARRVRKLGLADFADYRKFLLKNKETELIELVNSVTTNLTSFFRENHHFEFVRDTLVPQARETGRSRLRIWSAGCSTGEEPYSIAMTIADSIPDYTSWDIRIYATDLDSNVVAKAASGIYEESRVEGIDPALVQRHFRRGVGPNSGMVKVKPEIQRLIQFSQLNLLHPWPLTDSMNAIFCRNVVIYFDKPTKTALVDRYADKLVDQGYLFMGHSESLYKTTERFQLLGKTIYQKLG